MTGLAESEKGQTSVHVYSACKLFFLLLFRLFGFRLNFRSSK